MGNKGSQERDTQEDKIQLQNKNVTFNENCQINILNYAVHKVQQAHNMAKSTPLSLCCPLSVNFAQGENSMHTKWQLFYLVYSPISNLEGILHIERNTTTWESTYTTHTKDQFYFLDMPNTDFNYEIFDDQIEWSICCENAQHFYERRQSEQIGTKVWKLCSEKSSQTAPFLPSLRYIAYLIEDLEPRNRQKKELENRFQSADALLQYYQSFPSLQKCVKPKRKMKKAI